MSLLVNTKVEWKLAIVGMDIKSEFLKQVVLNFFIYARGVEEYLPVTHERKAVLMSV